MKDKVFLKLFVAGNTARSIEAIDGIKVAFHAYLEDRGTLEVIDVLEKPELAVEENVLATPTLIRLLPVPIRRLIGDFSDGKKAFDLLDLIEEKP